MALQCAAMDPAAQFAIQRGCHSAVTVRVTDKRLLTRRPDPCRGIVGRRVVPLSRSAPNAGLSRRDPYGVLSRLASRIIGQRDLTLERKTKGRRSDKDSLGAPHVYLAPGGFVAPFSGFQMDELRDAIALLFKRKGRDELSEREFVLSASMDLHWFPPRDAQRLLQIGLETKLLESQSGTIRPAFD